MEVVRMVEVTVAAVRVAQVKEQATVVGSDWLWVMGCGGPRVVEPC